MLENLTACKKRVKGIEERHVESHEDSLREAHLTISGFPVAINQQNLLFI